MVCLQEREPSFECTFVNLQGKIDCKHEILFNKGFKPSLRGSWKAWPKTPWENLERLADAGIQMKLGIPVCKRCKGWCLIISSTTMSDHPSRAWTYDEVLQTRKDGDHQRAENMRKLQSGGSSCPRLYRTTKEARSCKHLSTMWWRGTQSF